MGRYFIVCVRLLLKARLMQGESFIPYSHIDKILFPVTELGMFWVLNLCPWIWWDYLSEILKDKNCHLNVLLERIPTISRLKTPLILTSSDMFYSAQTPQPFSRFSRNCDMVLSYEWLYGLKCPKVIFLYKPSWWILQGMTSLSRQK